MRNFLQESYYLDGNNLLYSYVQPFSFLKKDFSPSLSLRTLGLLFRRKVLKTLRDWWKQEVASRVVSDKKASK